jgi:hypothetical protein
MMQQLQQQPLGDFDQPLNDDPYTNYQRNSFFQQDDNANSEMREQQIQMFQFSQIPSTNPIQFSAPARNSTVYNNNIGVSILEDTVETYNYDRKIYLKTKFDMAQLRQEGVDFVQEFNRNVKACDKLKGFNALKVMRTTPRACL